MHSSREAGIAMLTSLDLSLDHRAWLGLQSEVMDCSPDPGIAILTCLALSLDC